VVSLNPLQSAGARSLLLSSGGVASRWPAENGSPTAAANYFDQVNPPHDGVFTKQFVTDMTQLAEELPMFLDRPVLDRTGLASYLILFSLFMLVMIPAPLERPEQT
jgi:hypothetical protein